MGEGSYVKSYDGGVRIETHNAQGFVPTKIASFLMNLHVQGKPVFIRLVFYLSFFFFCLIIWCYRVRAPPASISHA